jgi:dihydrofolate synthase/folylpolyglutamate synthase
VIEMRFNTLAEWLAWQETLHPSEIELGLERVSRVLAAMGLAAPAFSVITVAGTNGKGSTVAMLEAIPHAAGYRVGSYTSPHLLHYNERIRIGGDTVSDAELCDAFARVDAARGETSLTYFEFGTLAALDILQRRGVEIAVLEVGLGGRLDAVNVLDPDVAVITPVDVDHVQWLGADREAIGREKAGILRPGRPLVCTDPAPPRSIAAEAERLGATYYQLGRDFSFEVTDGQWAWQGGGRRRAALPPPALRGDYQLANAAGALMVLELLRERFPVDQGAVRSGLASVQLPGRFQVLPGLPLQILDVAHNPHGARALAHNLRQQPCAGRTLAVLAMLADKDIPAVVKAMAGVVDAWYLAALEVPRAASLQHLQEALQQALPTAVFQTCPGVAAARRRALSEAASEDRIVIFGSFYTVAAALAEAV